MAFRHRPSAEAGIVHAAQINNERMREEAAAVTNSEPVTLWRCHDCGTSGQIDGAVEQDGDPRDHDCSETLNPSVEEITTVRGPHFDGADWYHKALGDAVDAAVIWGSGASRDPDTAADYLAAACGQLAACERTREETPIAGSSWPRGDGGGRGDMNAQVAFADGALSAAAAANGQVQPDAVPGALRTALSEARNRLDADGPRSALAWLAGFSAHTGDLAQPEQDLGWEI